MTSLQRELLEENDHRALKSSVCVAGRACRRPRKRTSSNQAGLTMSGQDTGPFHSGGMNELTCQAH
jgi:hypothetical protein